MRKLFFILLIIGFIQQTKAQDRFFEFLPGWRNTKIIEKQDKYISFGFTSIGSGFNHYQFSSFTKSGVIIDEWEFDLDTVQNLFSLHTNDVSNVSQQRYISGFIKGIDSERFYGTMIKFNNDFTDTLSFTSFNILPGNATAISSHLALNSNKFILGVRLRNTSLISYASLMQSDSLGNINWRSDFYCSGGSCVLYPFHILQAADGGYFLTCAEVHGAGGSGANFYEYTAIIKTDSLGNEQYRLHPGNPDHYNYAGWVLPTDDGNYITAYSNPMLGVLEQNPEVNPESTIWLYKFDIDGNVIFNESLDLPLDDYGETYEYTIHQMIALNNGNIIIIGEAGVRFGFILKVKENGELYWFRLIEPPQGVGNDAEFYFTKVYGITPTTDGGYIMAGEYFSLPGNVFPEGMPQTAFAAKVDQYGCLEPGCQLADAVPELTKADLGLLVYPNPATETINISVAENVKVARIRIYEITGRIVLQPINGLPLGACPPGRKGGLRGIDVRDLSPGIYLVEVETEDGLRQVKRVVIEK